MKQHSPPPPSPAFSSLRSKASTAALLLLPISVVALLFLAVDRYEFQLQSAIDTTAGCEPGLRAATAHFVDPVVPQPALRVFIGILTRPDTYERRHLLRTAYAVQPPPSFDARVDVRFVLCNLTTEEQRVLVALEILLYDDVVILNCSENLNDGKTFTYFSSLPSLLKDDGDGGRAPYDYVLKADDDSYVKVDALATALRGMPREDLYAGFYIPCGNLSDPDGWMTGMAYALSWDLVEWIVESDIPRNNKVHHPLGEDVVLAYWLRDGGRGRNRVDMNPRMYDIYVNNGPCYSRPFVPDSVVVHRLKDRKQWARTLRYFNVTAGLKPSKLYHID